MTTQKNQGNHIKLFLCAIIAEMGLAVNNLINTFFISRGLGESGAAAYEIVMPCMFVACALMALCYNGIQAICSKDYGAGDREAFRRHRNAGYGWTLLLMTVLALLFALLRESILDFLGANDADKTVSRLCRECYTMFLPCFLLQGFFCIASCLLFLEERRQLVVANIILYVCAFTGNILITLTQPSMTAYIAMNALSEAAADVYLTAYFLRRRGVSMAAPDTLSFRFADVKEALWTGLPDMGEYVFAAVLSLVENLYILSRFTTSLVAGLGVFEAVENFPETSCVGFCFLVTASLGTRVGRILTAAVPEERETAEADMHSEARTLTRGAVAGGLFMAVLLVTLARSVVGTFFSGTGDAAAADSAVWLIRAYAVGLVFYLLNSEIVCYYKLVKALPLAHAIYLAEALVFPLLARITLGELFGVKGFCMGGAASEALTFLLNLCFVWKACGHFPLRPTDFRMDPLFTEIARCVRADSK